MWLAMVGHLWASFRNLRAVSISYGSECIFLGEAVMRLSPSSESRRYAAVMTAGSDPRKPAITRVCAACFLTPHTLHHMSHMKI